MRRFAHKKVLLLSEVLDEIDVLVVEKHEEGMGPHYFSVRLGSAQGDRPVNHPKNTIFLDSEEDVDKFVLEIESRRGTTFLKMRGARPGIYRFVEQDYATRNYGEILKNDILPRPSPHTFY